MENIFLEKIYQIEIEKYKCPICHEIAFPPVKWWVAKPSDNNTTVCNHIYCLECTRLYFQLNKKIADRVVNRYECLICHQSLIWGSTITGVPKNANDVYYHCHIDDYQIIKLLIEKETNGIGKKCIENNCTFQTCCPEEMKLHCRNDCLASNIKCSYLGCYFTATRNFVREHEKTCYFKPVQCKLCQLKKNKSELIFHYQNHHRVEDNTFLQIL
jgi:hypothetical protein